MIVLLTTLEAAPIEEGLLPLLPQLTRRHTVLLAAVSDPRITEMAKGRGTVDAVYDAAAGIQAQAERRSTAEKLQRHGVVVVDATRTASPRHSPTPIWRSRPQAVSNISGVTGAFENDAPTAEDLR